MARSSSAQQIQTETDIAVLQVQYSNLAEKVDDLKIGLRDLHTDLKSHTLETQNLIKDYQALNVIAHTKLETKVSALEKWRWMLMGAGVLAGAMGWTVVSKLVGM